MNHTNHNSTSYLQNSFISYQCTDMTSFLQEREGLNIPQKLIKVGVAQYSSVNFDVKATIAKLKSIVEDAASKGVRLLLFPEAFIPAYPHGGDLGVVFGQRLLSGRKIYQMYHSSAVEIPGPEIDEICGFANTFNVFLIIGVIEKEVTSSSLYCSVVFIKEDGTLLGKHRKLVPTANERLCWSPGDGSTLSVFDSPSGRLGAVICWENYMPLLRATMYHKGIQIYCAPMADSSDSWQHVMRAVALEGRCFVLACNQFTRRSDYPPDSEFPNVISDNEGERVMCRGGSMIVSPLGQVLAGPNYTSEELLTAEIDVNEVIRGKFDLDVVGHYSRPDVFTLYVNETPNRGIVTRSSSANQSSETNSTHERLNQTFLNTAR